MRLQAKELASPFMENKIAKAMEKLVTQKVVDILGKYIQLDSYITYLAGFGVWDVIMTSIMVWYQSLRHTQPTKLPDSQQILDTFCPSILMKLYTSTKSPLCCTIDMRHERQEESENKAFIDSLDNNYRSFEGPLGTLAHPKASYEFFLRHKDSMIVLIEEGVTYLTSARSSEEFTEFSSEETALESVIAAGIGWQPHYSARTRYNRDALKVMPTRRHNSPMSTDHDQQETDTDDGNQDDEQFSRISDPMSQSQESGTPPLRDPPQATESTDTPNPSDSALIRDTIVSGLEKLPGSPEEEKDIVDITEEEKLKSLIKVKNSTKWMFPRSTSTSNTKRKKSIQQNKLKRMSCHGWKNRK